MSDGGERSICLRERPVGQERQMAAQRARMSSLIRRLHVVRETGSDGDGGRRVAALAAESARSLPTVPIWAGVQKLVICKAGSR